MINSIWAKETIEWLTLTPCCCTSQGPVQNSGPTIQDYLSRPRPTWEELKEQLEEEEGLSSPGDFEDKMNEKKKKEKKKSNRQPPQNLKTRMTKECEEKTEEKEEASARRASDSSEEESDAESKKKKKKIKEEVDKDKDDKSHRRKRKAERSYIRFLFSRVLCRL
ncbi:hypothetical protein INR49_023598 [Caranx melampygus]|nr:hypothetical protein INR49_023598 [Caranx melampygus]